MRVTKDVMEAGHRRIVDGAARLIRERGVRGTSVGDAMKEADLTHGGFYRHFGSKDELVAAALTRAFDAFALPLAQRRDDEPPDRVTEAFRSMYLSDAHVATPGRGCPMPALAGEVARESDAVKHAFGAGVRRMIDALAGHAAPAVDGAPAGGAIGGSPDQDAAVRALCEMVGAVMLARASDPDTAARILAAVRANGTTAGKPAPRAEGPGAA